MVKAKWREYYEQFAKRRLAEDAPQGPYKVVMKGVMAPITMTELKQMIGHLHNGKATGPDNVSAELLKLLTEPVLKWLLGQYNTILRTRKVPEELKTSTVLPLMKTEDAHPGDPSARRPITLIPVL